MLALKIIGGIVLFFALLMLVRVGCRVDYSAGGLFLWLKVACFRISILPSKPLTPEQEEKKQRKDAEKKAKKKAKKAAEQAKDEAPKEKGDLKWLLELIGPALKALNRLRRKLRVDHLKLDYAIGGAGDPAQAAIRYGQVSAGGGALFPLLNAALDVRDWDVNLSVDFCEEKSKVALSATATYRIGQLLAIGISLGVKALVVYLKHEKQAEQKEELSNGRKASNR